VQPSSARWIVPWVAGLAGFVALNFLFYRLSLQSYTGDSDKASTILEGQAVGSGHLLLHGWIMPLDSFWTLDQAYYAVVTRIVPLGAPLIHLGPAFFASMLVVAGIAAVYRDHRGARALAGSAVVLVLLAFPTPFMANFFLGFAYHISTAVVAVAAFLAFADGRFGWRWAIGVLLLVVGLLGDLLLLAYAVVPLVLAGVVAMLRRRDWRAGVAPIAGAAASAGLAEAARRTISALGGFVATAPLPTAHRHQVLVNVKHVFVFGSRLIGLTPTGGRVPHLLLGAHAVAAILMIACFLAALWRLTAGAILGRQASTPEPAPDAWRVDDMLVIATFGASASFAVMSLSSGLANTRYLVPAVLFTMVLSGRMVADAWPLPLPVAARRALAGVGVAAVAAFSVGLGYQLAPPTPVNPAIGLSRWLEEHHLHNGLGDYWAASITTVASGGAVTVRPVSTSAGDRLIRTMNQSPAAWYARQEFQFLVYGVPVWDNVDTEAAANTWGLPSHLYSVGPFRVLVWSHPIEMAPFPDP
jgi:hypothetical protein